MNLTQLQKTIVKDILEERITSIDSFIRLHITLSHGKNKTNGTFSLGDNYNIESGQEIFTVIDEKEALSQLRQFVVLLNQLEKSDLIFSLPITKQPPFPLFRQDGNPYRKALHIIFQYTAKEIVSFPELSDFVKNNFLTTDELKANDEAADRKESLRLTRKVAYITVGISIAISLISVLFNYLTYTKERVVTISNPGAFSDTTKVLILTQQRDSTKVDTTKTIK